MNLSHFEGKVKWGELYMMIFGQVFDLGPGLTLELCLSEKLIKSEIEFTKYKAENQWNEGILIVLGKK